MLETILLAIAGGIFWIGWQLRGITKRADQYMNGYARGLVKSFEVGTHVREFEKGIGRKSTAEDLPEFEAYLANKGVSINFDL